jgi:hypothetical protein
VTVAGAKEKEEDKDVTLFLRIVRDTIVCFSRCAVEGRYWPDASLGKMVEDQPFPLTFMPSERVFCKDDCEGRASQVIQVEQLLRQMHLCAERIGLEALVRTVRGMRSFACLLSGLEESLVAHLVEGCCALGALFERGVLEAQMTVGDAHIGSMADAVTGVCQPHLVGHSFGVLIFRSAVVDATTTTTTAAATKKKERRGGRYGACILEATGWCVHFHLIIIISSSGSILSIIITSLLPCAGSEHRTRATIGRWMRKSKWPTAAC